MGDCKYPDNCQSKHRCLSCGYDSGCFRYCHICSEHHYHNDIVCEMKKCIRCGELHRCIVCNKLSGIFDVCDDCGDYAMANIACKILAQ
jgi:hypothetical protein